MTRDEELAAIRDYIARKGVSRIVPSDYLAHIGWPQPQFSKTKHTGWCKGKPHSPRWRYNLALAYASHHGLSAPSWTDVLEAELLALRKHGHSYRQIAKIMGKTKAAIQARVRYLRLGRRLFVDTHSEAIRALSPPPSERG